MSHTMKAEKPVIYVSLGSREHKVRNARMASVKRIQNFWLLTGKDHVRSSLRAIRVGILMTRRGVWQEGLPAIDS
ncbi:MAG: hypothetical protein ACLRMZ_09785 [Blautia marasmi]